MPRELKILRVLYLCAASEWWRTFKYLNSDHSLPNSQISDISVVFFFLLCKSVLLLFYAQHLLAIPSGISDLSGPIPSFWSAVQFGLLTLCLYFASSSTWQLSVSAFLGRRLLPLQAPLLPLWSQPPARPTTATLRGWAVSSLSLLNSAPDRSVPNLPPLSKADRLGACGSPSEVEAAACREHLSLFPRAVESTLRLSGKGLADTPSRGSAPSENWPS